MSRDAVIELPVSLRHGSEGGTIRELFNVSNFTSTFSSDVGRGKETHRETFEWRKDKESGWKLVRLSSDQKEVVALLSGNSWAVSKVAKFHFRGAGSRASLGTIGALMVVMFSFWIFQDNVAAAGAGAGAG